MKKRVVKKRIDINHICSFNENIPEKGNLYLGSVGILSNVDDLKQKQIGCILTILDDWAYSHFQVKQKIQKAQISISKRIKMQDDLDASIFSEFENACEFIKEHINKTNIFVHCQMGISRSSSLVIAYLMLEKGWGRQQTRQYVKQRRQYIQPNDKFWKQLQAWEDHVKKVHKK